MNISVADKDYLKIQILGPFTVTTRTGENLTPKTQKACAVLAMLSLANNGTKTRSWLKDKLWSGYAEQRAAANLRQALTEIRKSLGEKFLYLLNTDNTYVKLKLDCVDIDIDYIKSNYKTVKLTQKTTNTDLLEGMDIKDHEFEEWLRIERTSWAVFIDEIEYKKYSGDNGRDLQLDNTRAGTEQFSYGVGILPATIDRTCLGSASESVDMSELITEQYMNSIKDISYIPVYDFRDRSPQNKIESNNLVAVYFHCTINVHDSSLIIVLKLLDSADYSILFTETVKIPRKKLNSSLPEIPAGISKLTENTQEIIYQHISLSSKLKISECLAINGVHQMFLLDKNHLEYSKNTLLKSLEYNECSQTYAWLGFINSFLIGQQFVNKKDVIEETRYFISRSKQMGLTSPLAMSIIAYLESSLFSNNDLAAKYFGQAIGMNPNHALAWDLYSIYNVFLGDLDSALKAGKWANHLGMNSPISHYYQTSLCMINSLRGEHEIAIEYGNNVLVDRPNFNTVLRYMVSSYSNLGDQKSAIKTRNKLIAIEPDVSIGALRHNKYPVLQIEQGSSFINGLLQAGIPLGD